MKLVTGAILILAAAVLLGPRFGHDPATASQFIALLTGLVGFAFLVWGAIADVLDDKGKKK